jgi:hypothetical protein
LFDFFDTPDVLEHSLENRETVERISQFLTFFRVCDRQNPQALLDSLLSHVDTRGQLVPVEFHYRGSIKTEPIPAIVAH